MRFIIYKNSVLATLCSMFGASFLALAALSLISGEMDILSGIGAIAIGIGLMLLADFISERKAKRKQRKASQETIREQNTASGAGRARNTQTVQVLAEKPVKQSALFAGFLFLLAALLTVWAEIQYSEKAYVYMFDSETAMLVGMGILLMVAALRTLHIRQVSVLFVIAFLFLTWGSIDVAMLNYDDYSYVNPSNPWIATYPHLLRVAAYLLMTVISLFSMPKFKERLSGFVRLLWIVPVPLLLLACIKEIQDSIVGDLFAVSLEKGFQFPPRPEFLEVIAQFFAILATFLVGFSFKRICQKPRTVYVQQEPQPEPHYTAPEPQPEPRYADPEPPKHTSQTGNQDVQKKIQAYKDLLELGILTQEEYDEKIRELMR